MRRKTIQYQAATMIASTIGMKLMEVTMPPQADMKVVMCSGALLPLPPRPLDPAALLLVEDML